MTALVTKSLSKLAPGRRVNKPLSELAPAAGIGAAEGFAQPQQPASAGGSGIAWPLTETAFEDREVYPEETLYTSDGIFSWTRQRYKALKMKDATGTTGKILLKAPAA